MAHPYLGIQNINFKTKRNMKKFILTENGKEVKNGDLIIKYKKYNDSPLCRTFTSKVTVVNESTLPDLIASGVIKSVEENNNLETQIPNQQYYHCIEKIAERMGWNPNKVVNHLNAINSIYPTAAFSIILREIAVTLDSAYSDHIQNSPKIYSVSPLNGKITEVNKAHIKNYKNFAAFRTMEDARTACRITRELLKKMFKSDK